MKRSALMILLATFCIAAMAVAAAAQTATAGTSDTKMSGTTKNLYVKTIYALRVYPMNEGYQVDYLTSKGTVASTYLPIEWFMKSASKGELVRETNASTPFMEIVYDGGAFKLVRLHVAANYSDPMWSHRIDPNAAEKFKVEAPVLVY